jgi:hypothetical protein
MAGSGSRLGIGLAQSLTCEKKQLCATAQTPRGGDPMAIPGSQTVSNTIEEKIGVVVSVDLEKGILTLWHNDGARSYFNPGADLLGNLRIGGPVQALVDGAIIRALRCL